MQNPSNLIEWRNFHLSTINHIRANRVASFTSEDLAWFRSPVREGKR